jgi:hypothetical protein
VLSTDDRLHTADGFHTLPRIAIVSGEMTRQGRRLCISATATGGLQGLQALSLRRLRCLKKPLGYCWRILSLYLSAP